jgi:hypothetical protein
MVACRYNARLKERMAPRHERHLDLHWRRVSSSPSILPIRAVAPV